MVGKIKMHDVVALLQDVQTKHFESGQALVLRRGQIGTVVMTYQDGAFEVEFADRDGRAFAILPLRPDQLMVLYDTPDFAAA
jgi:CRP-like cAMP-binding protein